MTFYRYACLCLTLTLAMPAYAGAADLGTLSDTLGNIGGVLRDADAARERYERRSSDANYEREWRDREYKLEETRVDEVARQAGVSRSQVRDMRADGRSWDEICRRYNVDTRRIGYGSSSNRNYDRDRDNDLYRGYYDKHPKGGPPGLMKKGGMPPGQAKKQKNW